MRRSSLIARITVLPVAILLTAAGVTVGSASTAQAGAPVCRHMGAISFSSGTLSAWAELWCHEAPNPDIWMVPDPIVIKRLNAGTWSPFLSGMDDTLTYQCASSATNSYRLDNGYILSEIDNIPCG